jgi:hypothetical protein
MDETSATSGAATDAGGSVTRRGRRAARRNEALAERLLRRGVAGRRGLGATLALALSLLVVTLTVLCVVGGVAVAILGRHSPLLVGLGLIVAVTAVAVFPVRCASVRATSCSTGPTQPSSGSCSSRLRTL